MKITCALDFQKISIDLHRELKTIPYNLDLYRMLDNIENMVRSLSQMEVIARRVHKYPPAEEHLEKINKAIDHFEKLLLMAKLMA